MNQHKNHQIEKMLVAGPCALESREQLRQSVQVLKAAGVSMIRASLWKPRTRPGWEGLGWMSLPLLLEETLPHGMIPATEIICAEHAQMIVQGMEHFGPEAKMIVWLGSRNQNHLEQRKISKILAAGPSGITFMFKNQMWEDEKHWLGICEHILSEGFPRERLMICHRGFCPGKAANPKKYRNLPDFEMAMRVKEQTGLPMLLDPSHIGGSPENVLEICMLASTYHFDGFLIEVHCDPANAKTDAAQQLNAEQFSHLLKIIHSSQLKEKIA